MVFLKHVGTLPGDGSPYLTSISDIDLVMTGSQPTLYVGTLRGGGLSAYAIGADGGPDLIGSRDYTAAHQPGSTVELLSVRLDGADVLLTAGLGDAAHSAYGLTAAGGFSGAVTRLEGAPIALQPAGARSVAVDLGGQSVIFAADAGAAMPRGHLVGPGGTLDALPAPEGTGAPAEGTITALGVVNSGGNLQLLAGMSGDNRLLSYRIGADGRLDYAETEGAETGVPLNTPTAIAAAAAGGESYAIVAAAGNDSLTTLRIAADGRMTPVDQVIDDRTTRFADVNRIEVVTAGERDYVLAAGSDDGISLFTLLPNGRLFHLSSLADDARTTLQNVSAIAAHAEGDVLYVYAASDSEAGLTTLSADLGRQGVVVRGDAGAPQISGTGRDDILIAEDGAVVMTGGAGRDSFIFNPAGATADGKLGRIADFEPGTDRIDLSGFALLHGVDQLQITETAEGATLRFGDFRVEVDAATPGPIAATSFSTADILNIGHVQVGPSPDYAHVSNTDSATPRGQKMTGGAGHDTIAGDGGADHLSGSAGNDHVNGLDGDDSLYGGDGNDTIEGGAGHDLLDGGGEAGDDHDWLDGGDGNDTITGGSAGSDRMIGGLGDDLIRAHGGNDTVDGGAGRDTIHGGDGLDTLIGGAGDDSITGGSGVADLRDQIYGGDGNDTIDGGHGNDSISAGAGHDQIEGGFGSDTLVGNDGGDSVSGGALSDLIYGGPGTDFLNGGFGYDRLNGGAGGDRFFHLGVADHGSDWIQDYDAPEGDVLLFGRGNATADQFQVNYAETANAGQAGVAEAFVIFKPTGQIIWALVDGAEDSALQLQFAGNPALYDLLG